GLEIVGGGESLISALETAFGADEDPLGEALELLPLSLDLGAVGRVERDGGGERIAKHENFGKLGSAPTRGDGREDFIGGAARISVLVGQTLVRRQTFREVARQRRAEPRAQNGDDNI